MCFRPFPRRLNIDCCTVQTNHSHELMLRTSLEIPTSWGSITNRRLTQSWQAPILSRIKLIRGKNKTESLTKSETRFDGLLEIFMLRVWLLFKLKNAQSKWQRTAKKYLHKKVRRKSYRLGNTLLIIILFSFLLSCLVSLWLHDPMNSFELYESTDHSWVGSFFFFYFLFICPRYNRYIFMMWLVKVLLSLLLWVPMRLQLSILSSLPRPR